MIIWKGQNGRKTPKTKSSGSPQQKSETKTQYKNVIVDEKNYLLLNFTHDRVFNQLLRLSVTLVLSSR